MTTTQYLRAYARFWWVIVLCVGVGLGLALWAGAAAPNTYEASGDLVLGTTRAVPRQAAAYSSANALAQQRAVSYAAAADGAVLAKEVLDTTKSGPQTIALTRRLSITVPSGSTVLTVTATAHAPGDARALAITATEAMSRLVTDLEKNASGNRPLLKARPVPGSLTAPSEVALPAWRNPLLSGIAGLLVGLALAVALARLRPRLRDPKVVSEMVSAPVLGVVPWRRRDTSPEKYDAALEELRSGVFFLRPNRSACLLVAITAAAPVTDLRGVAEDVAAGMSEAGARVLLIDSDLPDATHSQAGGSSAGLSDYLRGAALRGLVTRSEAGYHVMGAGMPTDEPADLLHRPALDTLLEQAAERYDYVLVVAPAASEGTGGPAVAARCSATVLVVDEKTRLSELRESLRVLASVAGVQPRGAVLLR